MSVTVSAGRASRHSSYYYVPLTVTVLSATSGAGIAGASATLDIYAGSSCSGSIAASGTFSTASNGSLSVNFRSTTATTWCVQANVSATGYTAASAQAIFNT